MGWKLVWKCQVFWMHDRQGHSICWLLGHIEEAFSFPNLSKRENGTKSTDNWRWSQLSVGRRGRMSGWYLAHQISKATYREGRPHFLKATHGGMPAIFHLLPSSSFFLLPATPLATAAVEFTYFLCPVALHTSLSAPSFPKTQAERGEKRSSGLLVHWDWWCCSSCGEGQRRERKQGLLGKWKIPSPHPSEVVEKQPDPATSSCLSLFVAGSNVLSSNFWPPWGCSGRAKLLGCRTTLNPSPALSHHSHSGS